jgi:putative SOS response-associated peptidase YedK
LFVFAGLWVRWHDPEGEEIEICAILTTPANALMQPIHERMPVILGPSAEEQWLDPRCTPDSLSALLVPFAADHREAHPVNPYVSNAKNEGPRYIEPAGA